MTPGQSALLRGDVHLSRTQHLKGGIQACARFVTSPGLRGVCGAYALALASRMRGARQLCARARPRKSCASPVGATRSPGRTSRLMLVSSAIARPCEQKVRISWPSPSTRRSWSEPRAVTLPRSTRSWPRSPPHREAAPALSRRRRGPAGPPAGDAHAGHPARRLVPRRLELLHLALPRDGERGAHADAVAAAPPRAAGRGARARGARQPPGRERRGGASDRGDVRAANQRARRARPRGPRRAPAGVPRRRRPHYHQDLGLQEIADAASRRAPSARACTARARASARSSRARTRSSRWATPRARRRLASRRVSSSTRLRRLRTRRVTPEIHPRDRRRCKASSGLRGRGQKPRGWGPRPAGSTLQIR